MHPVTYSWIGLLAASPLVFLLCAWALGVFHSYRRYWRSVDLFLLAIFVQELLTAVQVFIFSLLSLVQPSTGATCCSIFVWSLSATRTLQAATLTSLLVDRALTSQWPYKYRFSVRRHQIRYHLVVLATMAALVGVASILARPSEAILGDPDISGAFGECQFLPHSLHVRLALFLLSLYGILFVISAVSACVVQTTRGGCKGGSSTHQEPHDMSPITHGTTGSSTTTASSGRPLHPTASTASTASSTSSGGRLGGGLQASSSTTDLVTPPLRPFHMRGVRVTQGKLSASHRAPSADFRWGATLSVAAICFFVNHLPYIGVLVMGTFFPGLLPEWPMENLTLWLSLFEGLLLPLGLGIFDPTFGEAAILSCSRDNRSPAPKYDDRVAPFRLIPKEEIKSFPLTNGSLFSSLLNIDAPLHALPPYNRAKLHPSGLRMGTSSAEFREIGGIDRLNSDARIRGNFGQLFYNPDGPNSIGSIANGSSDPIYSDPLNKAVSLDSSLKLADDDHIYATLSETFGSLSSMSDEFSGENHRCSSATTVANDDFEYHGPRMNRPDNFSHLGRPLPELDRSLETHSSVITPRGSFSHLGTSTEAGFVSACNHAINTNRTQQSLVESQDLCSSSYDEDSSPSSSFRSCSSTDQCDSVSMENEKNTEFVEQTFIDPRASPRLGFVNEAFESDTLEKRDYFNRVNDENDLLNTSLPEADEIRRLSVDIQPSVPSEGTLTKKHRSSSLSMNDLDRLEHREQEQEEEMMFILPVKSESMLSLYRLYLAEDEDSGCTNLHYSLEVSKSESDLTGVHNNAVDGKSKPDKTSVQEIYQKKRVPMSAGSRIRRQNKIQRAKGLHNRVRPVILPTQVERPEESQREHDNQNINHTKYQRTDDDVEQTQGVQLAVMNKAKRKNGIITIKDPSVLSVEELFNVLSRASVSEDDRIKKDTQSETFRPSSVNSYPNTEYKKIFVSEYI